MYHKNPRHKKYFKKEGHLGWANWKCSALKAKFKMKYKKNWINWNCELSQKFKYWSWKLDQLKKIQTHYRHKWTKLMIVKTRLLPIPLIGNF
jgi:hypothetical protein